MRKVKNVENETQHWRTWNMARKTEKMWKMRQTHCRTGNIARNTEKCEK
jgi:hypothetical protein